MLKNKTIREFLREVSAKTSTPAGGSVAALSGALAAGLVLMSTRISGHKAEKAVKYQKNLVKFIDEDSKAFNLVMSAYRLPKTKSRKTKIDQALKQATRVPLQTAQYSYEVLRLAERLVVKVKPSVISDIGVGVLLAEVSIRSALLNVRTNLNSIKDRAFKKRIETGIRKILDYSLIAKKANRIVQKRMG